MLVTQPAEVFAGASPVQPTGDVTPTQPSEAPGMRRNSAVNMTATWPVEAHGTGRCATQPVEAPGASSDVQMQPTGTGGRDSSPVDQSITGSPVLELLLTILVCLTQKMRWLVNWNPLLQRVTRKCCQRR